MRAQDDGALAGATDMRPSTSIEGCTAIESAGFPTPSTAQPTLPATSFVPLAPTRRVVVLFRRPVSDARPELPKRATIPSRVLTNPPITPFPLHRRSETERCKRNGGGNDRSICSRPTSVRRVRQIASSALLPTAFRALIPVCRD